MNLLWYEKVDGCKNSEDWERRLPWGESVPSSEPQIKTSGHQLSLVPHSEKPGSWKRKTLTNSQHCCKPVGQQVSSPPAVWAAILLVLFECWWALGCLVHSLAKNKENHMHWSQSGLFHKAGHTEQFPLGKSILLLLIVLFFIYLAVASVRMCCTVLSRKWG